MRTVFPRGISIEHAEVSLEDLQKGSLFKPVAKALVKLRGKEIIERANASIALTAQDGAAKVALDKAQAPFRGGQDGSSTLTKQVHPADGTVCIMGNAQVMPNATDVLFGALSNLKEADRLWTPRGRMAAKRTIAMALKDACSFMLHLDVAMSCATVRYMNK